ncbi:MAG: hypothetical protein ABI779_19280, partial [Acidobacteriota bacterium]
MARGFSRRLLATLALESREGQRADPRESDGGLKSTAPLEFGHLSREVRRAECPRPMAHRAKA